VLGVQAVVVSGLPIPLGCCGPAGRVDAAAEMLLSGKDQSRPFPCMHRPCGCMTAEQCFRDCCCHTPAETLRWARANRVEPSVLAALERRVAIDASSAAADGCCTAAAEEPSCCTACCEPDAPEPPESQKPQKTTDPGEPVSAHTLSLGAMLACQGVVAEWFATGLAIVPPVMAGAIEPSPAQWVVAMADDHLLSRHAPPDPPPPRA